MKSAEYLRALDAALRDYERGIAERAVLDARIAQLQQTINTLSRLCGLQPTVPWGLTDACRTLLRNAGRPLSAVEIRARLTSIGFDLNRYSNPLAAIHTVLKRLDESGVGDRPGGVRVTPAARRRDAPTRRRDTRTKEGPR